MNALKNNKTKKPGKVVVLVHGRMFDLKTNSGHAVGDLIDLLQKDNVKFGTLGNY